MTSQIIHIEGNISSGKSRLLNALSTSTDKILTGLSFHREPIDEWTNFNSDNLMENFYTNQQRWSFCFNLHVYNTLVSRRQLIVNNSASAIFERSCMSTKRIFVPYAFEAGNMTLSEFTIFNNTVKNYKPVTCSDYYLYLSVPPEVCYERLIRRARPEELASDNLTLEWLSSLQKLHDVWFQDSPFIIDGTQPPEDVLSQALNYIRVIRSNE